MSEKKDEKHVKEKQTKTVLVVLGGPLEPDKTPSDILKSRIEKASSVILNNEVNPYFVVLTGGDPLKVGITEAEVMRNHLILDIRQKMYLDKKAKTTIENAINIRYKLNNVLKNFKVNLYVVTSDFHIDRAKLLFEHYFNDKNIDCKIIMISSRTNVTENEYNLLKLYEKKMISKLLESFEQEN